MAKNTKKKKNTSSVDHPNHYNCGSIEVIDYIDSTLGTKGSYYFCIGNVLKYVSRAEHKGRWYEDISKAQWYLNYAKKLVEKENKK